MAEEPDILPGAAALCVDGPVGGEGKKTETGGGAGAKHARRLTRALPALGPRGRLASGRQEGAQELLDDLPGARRGAPDANRRTQLDSGPLTKMSFLPRALSSALRAFADNARPLFELLAVMLAGSAVELWLRRQPVWRALADGAARAGNALVLTLLAALFFPSLDAALRVVPRVVSGLALASTAVVLAVSRCGARRPAEENLADRLVEVVDAARRAEGGGVRARRQAGVAV